MKRDRVWILGLAAEAVACGLLSFAVRLAPGWFTGLLAFPFEQIGRGLRRLSLSGRAGNGIAVVLYLVICLIPTGIFLFRRRRFRKYGEDWLLVVLSLVLFFVIYHLVNPGLLGGGFLAAGTGSGAMLGGVVYSVIIGYLVWHAMRLFAGAGTGALQRYLYGLLVALTVLFTYAACGPYLGELLESFAALREGNTGMGQNLFLTELFLVLGYVGKALPCLLDILVVFGAANLLREMARDPYSEDSVQAAERLSRICSLSLAAGAGLCMAFNLMQLFFAGELLVIRYSVQIPVTSAVFVLASLLFARYVRVTRELKEDNDLFI